MTRGGGGAIGEVSGSERDAGGSAGGDGSTAERVGGRARTREVEARMFQGAAEERQALLERLAKG